MTKQKTVVAASFRRYRKQATGLGKILLVLAAAVGITLLQGCEGASLVETKSPETVSVPGDVATITEAVDLVRDGGLVLVSPGIYREQILVEKPGITIRGIDRNDTIIDGGGIRPYGIVAVADGVTVENLSVTGATFYGVLFTGMFSDGEPGARNSSGYTDLDPSEHPPLQQFLADHVTAYNNGLYGIYAFNAQNGVIRDSYASGSADSGIYVGQCRDCNILVQGNSARDNAVGFENANASDSVWVVENDVSGNRVGMTFLSNYQEAFSPQRANWVAANRIVSNTSSESPSHAQGSWGVGIGLSGAGENIFEKNLIADNPVTGVMFANAEDIPTTENEFRGNSFSGNGVDLLNVSTERAPAKGNCIDAYASSEPLDLFDSCSSPQPTNLSFDYAEAPPGISFLEVPHPPKQPNKFHSKEELKAPAQDLPNTIYRPEAVSLALPQE